MDPRMLPKGLDPNERNSERADNEPGVYIHPASGKILETAANNPGKIQADALVQFQYRKATDEEANQFRAERDERLAAQKKKEEKENQISEQLRRGRAAASA